MVLTFRAPSWNRPITCSTKEFKGKLSVKSFLFVFFNVRFYCVLSLIVVPYKSPKYENVCWTYMSFSVWRQIKSIPADEIL